MSQVSRTPKAAAPASLNGSRLIRYLTDLAVTDCGVSHQQFAERLGRLIDFSDSIILSAAHGELPTLAFEKTTESSAEVNDKFMSTRMGMVQFIVDSCVLKSCKTRIKFPSLDMGGALDPEGSFDPQTGFDAYHRFYLLQQRDMDIKIQHLRVEIRDSATGASPRLAQLAVLDTALGDTLQSHTRRFFSVIPKLLERRFKALFQHHQQSIQSTGRPDEPLSWSEPGGWIEQFCRESRGLLLAELDIRLQPVLGLVEALNEEVQGNH